MRAFLVAVWLFTAAASTQAAPRTFVSTAGSDADTCSLAAPCRSFGMAITRTDPRGEIVVLDSGGYGRVAIDRSVTIAAAPGVFAGISVFPGTNGVDINGAGIVVTLQGLTINGQGGDDGIVFTQGARLHIERCTVANLGTHGMRIQTGETYISDSAIRENGNNGIYAYAPVDLTVDRTRIERNAHAGLLVGNGTRATVTNSVIAGNGPSAGVYVYANDGASETVVSITDSSVSQNANSGISAQAISAGTTVRLAVARSTINRNNGTAIYMSSTSATLTAIVTDNAITRNLGHGGIMAVGAGLSATIANNAISGNEANGVRQASGALLRTRGNNAVQDNASDTTGTLTFVGGD
jgi:hypothetical protein